MILKVPYGKDGSIEVSIDDARVAGVVEPNKVETGDEAETIREALAHPYGYASLGEFLKGAKDVLFIVNDPTRPTPTARVLDFIEKDIEGYKVSFIVATGAHRAPTREEYIQIFSEK
ncbi:MAG: lactate racemase domain-containing protein, partial [Acidobacteriota bacterium]|nr:lactate racemase domain-containing protein [Acidobacteriota bacterium]